MSYFLINLDKPTSALTDLVGPFSTLELAEAYKEHLPYSYEYSVHYSSTPDMSLVAEKLVVGIVAANSTVHLDGTKAAVDIRKISSIRDLKNAVPCFSIKEAKEMVERVKFENGEFILISAWEAALLKNPVGNVPSTTPAGSCDCDDCTSFSETSTY